MNKKLFPQNLVPCTILKSFNRSVAEITRAIMTRQMHRHVQPDVKLIAHTPKEVHRNIYPNVVFIAK